MECKPSYFSSSSDLLAIFNRIYRSALIQALSQQKVQGDDIIDIRDNVRAQRAEMAFNLLSKSLDWVEPLRIIVLGADYS